MCGYVLSFFSTIYKITLVFIAIFHLLALILNK